MLVLFDQGTPVGLMRLLKKHSIDTARRRGWSTLKNGDLLQSAEDAGFQVLLTTDKNIAHQQNLNLRKLSIVVLGTTRRHLLQRMSAEIAAAVDSAQPGGYKVIEIPPA